MLCFYALRFQGNVFVGLPGLRGDLWGLNDRLVGWAVLPGTHQYVCNELWLLVRKGAISGLLLLPEGPRTGGVGSKLMGQ